MTPFSQLGPHVGVFIHLPKISTPPFSFSIASNEPVSVIQPTSADSPAATMVTVSCKPVGNAVPSIYLHVSDRATNADAAPPKPLNNATSSGIPVISTFTAIQYPIDEPIISPAIINVHSASPSANCISSIVVTTATSIPIAPNWFPLGAVLGWPSFFNPNMNRAAAIRYPIEVHSLISISGTSLLFTCNHV